MTDSPTGSQSGVDLSAIETKILGRPFPCIPFVEEVLGGLSVYDWRCKYAVSEREYEESLTSLFARTREDFDWAKGMGPEEKRGLFNRLCEKKVSNDFAPLRNPQSDFARMANLLDRLQHEKGKHYGDSWCKRGPVGVWMNIGRKVDRAERIVAAHAEGFQLGDLPVGEEGLVDQIADLATYSIMFLYWLEKHYPKQFEDWLERSFPLYEVEVELGGGDG